MTDFVHGCFKPAFTVDVLGGRREIPRIHHRHGPTGQANRAVRRSGWIERPQVTCGNREAPVLGLNESSPDIGAEKLKHLAGANLLLLGDLVVGGLPFDLTDIKTKIVIDDWDRHRLAECCRLDDMAAAVMRRLAVARLIQ